MVSRAVDRLNGDVIREICSHLCLPPPTMDDCNYAFPAETVSPMATSLPAASLISSIWRRPAQLLMVQYLYLNTHDKVIKFVAEHAVIQTKVNPSFSDSPVAIDVNLHLEDKVDDHIVSFAIVQILHLCRRLHFLRLPIPHDRMRTNFLDALSGLQGLRVFHLVPFRGIDAPNLLFDTQEPSIFDFLNSRWQDLISFRVAGGLGEVVIRFIPTVGAVRVKGTTCWALSLKCLVEARKHRHTPMSLKSVKNMVVYPVRGNRAPARVLMEYLQTFGSDLAILRIGGGFEEPNALDEAIGRCTTLQELTLRGANIDSSDMFSNLPSTLKGLSILGGQSFKPDRLAIALLTYPNLASLERLYAGEMSWTQEMCKLIEIRPTSSPPDEVLVL